MNTNGNTKPLEWFVNSLLQSTGQIELIAQHMLRFDRETGHHSGEGIDEILRELFSGTLQRGLDRDPAEYAAAAVLLADVRKVIEDEVYLVEPGGFYDLDLGEPEPADGADEAA